jgi:hypothetical protein
MCNLGKDLGFWTHMQVQESAAELKRTTAELTTTSDQLKMCKMELEGANAQLQVQMGLR